MRTIWARGHHALVMRLLKWKRELVENLLMLSSKMVRSLRLRQRRYSRWNEMTKRKVYGCLFAFTLAFIWGNSMLTREMSGAISQFVASVLGGESGTTEEGHYLVRKLAHFTEYAALGVVSHLLFDSLLQDKYINRRVDPLSPQRRTGRSLSVLTGMMR